MQTDIIYGLDGTNKMQSRCQVCTSGANSGENFKVSRGHEFLVNIAVPNQVFHTSRKEASLLDAASCPTRYGRCRRVYVRDN